jgi:penicillin-insensitive murein endopeptidase
MRRALVALGCCALALGAPAARAQTAGPGQPAASDDTAAVEDDLYDAEPEAVDGTDALPGVDEIARLLRERPAALGSISVGAPNAGALFNGVRLPESPRWVLVTPELAWCTEATAAAFARAVGRVHELFADTRPLFVGHASAERGGPLSPHLSHQSGRDVDVSYYYLGDEHVWYATATAANLDRPRTWALVKALVVAGAVELVLVDTAVQRLLRQHALASGEDRAWLDTVLQYGSRHPSPVVRHARGHATHMHLRFRDARAQALGKRAHDLLVARGVARPRPPEILHRARSGDTLGSLARRYGTTVEELRRANGLRSTRILAGRTYRIPRAPAGAPRKSQGR